MEGAGGDSLGLSHRRRHKCVAATLLLSADPDETGENTKERDEVFPSPRRKNDSSPEL